MNPLLNTLIQRIPALEVCARDIEAGFQLLMNTFETDHKLLLCGNGGSAADADHWAGELLKGFVHRRPIPTSMTKGLPESITHNLQWALPAIPLTGFPALSTAFANDVNPEFVFSQMAWAMGNEGDALAALSTSGNSKNVCAAAEVARFRKMPVLALTGKHGGELKKLADVCITVPASETYLVQEYHLPVYHCLSLMLEEAWARRLKEISASH